MGLKVLTVFAIHLGFVVAGGAIEIARLVPFATADSLRFTAQLNSEYSEPVSLEGTIVMMGSKEIFWKGKLDTADVRAGQPVGIEKTIQNLRPALWEPT